MPEPMVLHEGSWPWAPDKCPADQDIISWLDYKMPYIFNVLHVGTGGHHAVGLHCADNNIYCTGLTISPDEVQAYVALTQAFASNMTEYYKVMLANIHQMPGLTLPTYDVITLPHLGEDERSLAQGRNVYFTLRNLMDRTSRFIFYTGSISWLKVKPDVKEVLNDWGNVETYKSLLVVTKR